MSTLIPIEASTGNGPTERLVRKRPRGPDHLPKHPANHGDDATVAKHGSWLVWWWGALEGMLVLAFYKEPLVGPPGFIGRETETLGYTAGFLLLE